MIAKVIIVVLLALVAAATALPHKRAGVPNPKTVHHEVAVPKPKQNGMITPTQIFCFFIPRFSPFKSSRTSVTSSIYVEPKKLVCYYGSWAVYRPGDGKFDIEDIDPYVCTHLIFGFASLSVESWEIEAFDPWNDLDPEEGGGKGE